MSQKSKLRSDIWSILLSSSDQQRCNNVSLRDDEVRLTPLHNGFTQKQHLTPYFRWTPPYFIIFASIVEVLVFTLASPRCELALVYDPDRRYQPWRFLTYMLLHGDSLHLALNVVIQCLLAIPLENEQGKGRTAVVYLGGGLCGSLATSVLEPDLFIRGASAGVYALLISQLAHIILNFDVVPYIVYRGIAVVVIASADVAFTLHHFSLGNTCPRIGWAAHSAGAFAGLLIGLVIFKAAGQTLSKAVQHLLRWCAALMLAIGMVTVVGLNIFHSESGKLIVKNGNGLQN